MGAVNVYAKPIVVTSIAPLASFVAMIAGDTVDIHSLSNSNGCPHHYSLKPSDIKYVERAKALIYIDRDFDQFILPLLPKFHGQVLKISTLSTLVVDAKSPNWHIWLLPQNAVIILDSITALLIDIAPEHKTFFLQRLKQHKSQIMKLDDQRKQVIDSNITYNLLTDSAEYLFWNHSNVRTLYTAAGYHGIQTIYKMKQISSTPHQCFVCSASQNVDSYRNILGHHAQVISIETENWKITYPLEKLYYSEYDKIINLIKSCNDTIQP